MQVSRVTVDAQRSLGRLDRNLFGGFVEHLGRCINGGLFEEGSPLSNAQGFRADVIELLRPLRLSVLRWPGGNFVSNYHWADGIGPRERRPRRVELAWAAEEPNHFGTDEFLAYCAELGVTPYICLNMGTGSLEEALAWVEYCNSSAHSYWADRRRENGHDAAYAVPYWGLGNEMYGEWQVGQMTAQEYVSEARRWALAIRRLDPEAKLVSCGHSGWEDWDRTVIDGLAKLVDFHSLHIYTGSADYWANVLSPHQVERAVRYTSAWLSHAVYSQGLARTPRIAYDEWNVWYRTTDSTLEERYSFADAIAVATYLNIFVRSCRWVAMANLAQMVNAIAPIVTTKEASFVQPIYYPFLLHSRSALDEAVDVHVSAPTVDAPLPAAGDRWHEHHIADLGPFSVLDASATVDAGRTKVAVAIVNRGQEEAKGVEVLVRGTALPGNARVSTLTADARRPAPDIEGAKLEERSEPIKDERIVLDLPPSSFTVIETAASPSVT
jgi:alpha-N-arabinofuranosidase